MTALECDMELVSGSMKVAVRGAGPLGKFTATVSNFSVKGVALGREGVLGWVGAAGPTVLNVPLGEGGGRSAGYCCEPDPCLLTPQA